MQQINASLKSRTYVYHQIKSPEGKVVDSKEAEVLYRQGWVDTPAKFGKGFRGRYYSFLQFTELIPPFLRVEWKWLLGFIVSIVSLCIAYMKL